MKIIINEWQLRLIVENEDTNENLIDFTPFVDVNPIKWDDMFLLLKEKKERKGNKTYDGYYINGNVNLRESEVIELKYLVKVEGNLELRRSLIKSLPMLSEVWGNFHLSGSKIESLPDGLSVGGDLFLSHTPLSKATTLKELRNKIEVKGGVLR